MRRRPMPELHDELLEALRAERPESSASSVGMDAAAMAWRLEQIMAEPRRPQARRPVPRRALVAAGVAAAVVAGAVLAAGSQVDRPGVLAGGPPSSVAVIDITHIATTSQTALAASGRARLAFDLAIGTPTAQRGTGVILFSGDDLDMVVDFEDTGGRGRGFQARNRTVDGQFYLYDGPPGAQRWYRDANAAGSQGTDMFRADPRLLLGALTPAAPFEMVGTEAGVRHLRATRLDRLPSLNLSMGPIDPKDVTSLELWVGADDVVRRLDLETVQIEVRQEGVYSKVMENPDGTKTKVTIAPDPAKAVTVELRSRYSVEFTEVGVPVSIVAPDGAVTVEGKG